MTDSLQIKNDTYYVVLNLKDKNGQTEAKMDKYKFACKRQ
jgi:hypothetical protein